MTHQTRRQFVQGIGGVAVSLAGVALLGGCGRASVAPAVGEPPPETTVFKIATSATPGSGGCEAPKLLAEDFLRDEGFADVQYIQAGGGLARRDAVSDGQAHLTLPFVYSHIMYVEDGYQVVSLGGVHAGCFELTATDGIQGIRDLKAKTVGVGELGGGAHVLVAGMAAYVGLDPSTDITWVVLTPDEAIQRLGAGQIDAYMTPAPGSFDLRASGIGHVIVNTTRDRPWSEYFCCSVTMNRGFVQNYPVATKRALRAVLQASDFCAREPERAARMYIDRFPGDATYERALQTMQEIPYGHWRDFDPDDTLRFYSLRIREAGMIRGSPQEIISKGTDWSFLNAIKKELPRIASASRQFSCAIPQRSPTAET